MNKVQTENGLQDKQKQGRQGTRRIASNELSTPNSTPAWVFFNAFLFGLRSARAVLNKNKKAPDSTPDSTPNPHYFDLPKGLKELPPVVRKEYVPNENGVLESREKTDDSWLRIQIEGKAATRIKIKKQAFVDALEKLEKSGVPYVYQRRLVHCLFLILDKFRLVSATKGGEFDVTTKELVEFGIVPRGKSAKALFEAMAAILLAVELPNGKLFKQIDTAQRGKAIFTTAQGDVYKDFCGKHFVGIPKDALGFLSQRELLALRFVLCEKAFGKESASYNRLIKFAGFSLRAVEGRHGERCHNFLEKCFAKIQIFLNFDLVIWRGKQTLKEFFEKGLVDFVDKEVGRAIRAAERIPRAFIENEANMKTLFGGFVKRFYERHVLKRKAENTLQIVENLAGGGVLNELG